MKGRILLGLLLMCCIYTSAQSYVGVTTQSVRLRSEPSISSDNILETIPLHTEIFVSGITDYNGFYKVIDVNTNRYGYIASKYVYIVKQIQEDTTQVLEQTGKVESEYPQLTIENSTDKTLTLQVADETYYFSAYETRTVTLSTSGTVHIVASEADVMPYVGKDYVEMNYGYSWKFFIEKQY